MDGPPPAVPAKPGRLVGNALLYAISIFASLGVFLFGYDQGVMSGIITGPYFQAYFALTKFQLGTVVAILEIGALITSLAAGRVGDVIGRRLTLFWGAFVFTIGGVIQSFTIGVEMMIVGRLISGFGVGLLSTIVPIYQSEISPPNHRGALACMEFTGNIFGYAFSVWTDYACSFIDSDYSWRLPLFIQCIIGGILAGGSLLMPETPRWLIDTDRDDEGMRVLADLHGGDPNNPVALDEYQEIKDRVMAERDSGEARSYAVMWRKYKKRVLLAMSSQAFAQLNGINGMFFRMRRTCALTVALSESYFILCPSRFRRFVYLNNLYSNDTKTIPTEAGWVGRDAILMAGINALIYLLSTVPTWFLVDRWGRRAILMSGGVVMAIALMMTGWWMYIDVPNTPRAVVFCVIVYNAFFGYSWGPIPWLYPPEIMPLAVRAKGVSLSTATNWAFNFLVGESTPVLQAAIRWRLYPLLGFFCTCSFILVYYLYPETMGVPLEEMDAVFGEEERIEQEEEMEEEELERLALLSGRRRTLSLPFSHNYGAIPKPATTTPSAGPPPLPRSISWHGERQPLNRNDDDE
ncbi:hypothetical protein ACEPAI_642 [Sanghuangporus weigelae]